MCPIRADISALKNLGKCIYLFFVWLAVIGFRQNYFYIAPNFGDLGAKCHFFHYIINQKRNNFIKHCPPPVYQKAADIRDVYLYKKFTVQVGSWYTGGGGVTMFYRQKIKGVSAYNTQNTLYPMENYVNRPFSDKSMKFGIMVVHDLTKDISYNVELNRSKICYFGVK